MNTCEGKKQKEIKEERMRDCIRTLLFFLLALAVCLFARTYVARLTLVSGSSMNDTLQDNNWVITEKLSYTFFEPKRFDIILFPYTDSRGNTEYLVKRIIALPGETIEIRDGQIYINDELLDDPYAKEPWSYAGVAGTLQVMGDDEYFVMGDNRNDSTDSRAMDVYGEPLLGPVHRNDIVGKVWLRLTPINKFGFVD